jgi:hypothetical protein
MTALSRHPLSAYRVLPSLCSDHGSAGGGVAGGLAHVALWNSAYLLSGDMAELIAARAARRQPKFSKL